MLKTKPGVEFAVIAPAGMRILEVLRAVSAELDVDLTITSGTDGQHSGPHDPHKTGEAYDVRSHDLDPEMRGRVLLHVMDRLGIERFNGFLEDPGTPNAHFHFQRKKGTTYTLVDYFAA